MTHTNPTLVTPTIKNTPKLPIVVSEGFAKAGAKTLNIKGALSKLTPVFPFKF